MKNKLNIIIGEGELIIPSIALNTFIESPFIQIKNKYVFLILLLKNLIMNTRNFLTKAAEL